MKSKGDENKAKEHLVSLAARNPPLQQFLENEIIAEELKAILSQLKANFYRRVGKSIPKGKTFRDVFSERQYMEIIEETALEIFGECPPNLMEMLFRKDYQE